MAVQSDFSEQPLSVQRAFAWQALCHASTNVRIVAAPGGAAHAGLLEMETKAGGYGTVCGMNGVAADVACRQMGFDFGVVSPAGCAAYGGGSVCGASGSPIAAKNVTCSGMELSLGECEFEPADDACLSHAGDAVVFCGARGAAPFSDGQLRLISVSGAPALPHDAGRLEMYLVQAQAWAPVCRNGFTSGSAAVACKSMRFAGSAGFSGCATSGLCGAVAPHVADLACAGSESSVLQCPMAVADDVFCAPEESVVLSCSGAGDPVGKPL